LGEGLRKGKSYDREPKGYPKSKKGKDGGDNNAATLRSPLRERKKYLPKGENPARSLESSGKQKNWALGKNEEGGL